MDTIFCFGGNQTLARIAIECGWGYGVRSDYVAYSQPNFIDYPFKAGPGFWGKHLSMIERYRPVMAAVPDLEYPHQVNGLLRQCRQVRSLGVRPMVIPKYPGAVLVAPKDAIIGVSVPSRYAGWLPDPANLVGRDIHLLGAGVVKQMRLYRQYTALGLRVVSIDSSQHQEKAYRFGAAFVDGKWVDIRPRQGSTELFRQSSINIKIAWDAIEQTMTGEYHQLPLLGLAG